MRNFERPVVVMSKCIEHDHCRYNGDCIKSEIVAAMMPYFEIITVCPEVEIGLSIPREPIRIVKVDEKYHLYQPATEKKFTEEMVTFTDKYLNSLKDIDGFILKTRSPSCGTMDVKVYNSFNRTAGSKKERGFFGGAVEDRFGHLAVSDEGRLRNFTIREHFLTHLFVSAAFKKMKQSATMKTLTDFHAEHKFLFLGYNQGKMRMLGKIAANHEKYELKKVFEMYEKGMHEVFAKPPRFSSMVNVLQHMFGFFKNDLSSQEKQFFLSLLDQYVDERIPLSVPMNMIQSWAIRFNNNYLMKQAVLQPYPVELVEITDSGKGRKV